ncbi:MAG: BatA domain-containing protein, partial [Planctomycetota bacterium]
MFFDRSMFLWGLLAILIPIIIYLLFRQKYQRVPWAAMEFLLAAIRKNKRRLQIENLLLLLIRILIIAMLIGALAKPMLDSASALKLHVRGSRNVILLLDTSYSMGYRTGMRSSFEKAQQMAKKIVSGLERGDNIAIVPFHRNVNLREVEPIPISDARAKRALTGEIDALAVSAYPTNVAAAFEACVSLFKKLPAAQVYLYSDFTRAGWTRRQPAWKGEADDEAVVVINNPALANLLARLAKQDGFFTFVDVGPGDETAPNCTISSFLPEDSLTVTEFLQTFMVRVKNNGDEPVRGTLTFHVNGADAGKHAIEIKPRSETAFPFQHVFQETGSHNLGVVFDSDNLIVDNGRYLVLDVEKAVKVLLISGEKVMGGATWGDDEVDFVRMALNPDPAGTTRQRVSVIACSEIEPEELPRERLESYSFVVAANVGRLNEYEVGRLEKYVRAGGGLLIFLGELTQPERYNNLFWRPATEEPEDKEGDGEKPMAPPSLLPAKLLAPVMDKTRRNPFRMNLELPGHSCFMTEFPIPKMSVFGKASFQKFIQTKVDESDPNVRVLSTFSDDGRSPAIVE